MNQFLKKIFITISVLLNFSQQQYNPDTGLYQTTIEDIENIRRLDLYRYQPKNITYPTCDKYPIKSNDSTIDIEFYQPCLIKDLYYTLPVGFNDGLYQLQCNLGLALTWVKAKDCKQCHFENGQTTCYDNCNYGAFQKTHTCNPKKNCSYAQIESQIQIDNTMKIKGKLIQDTLSVYYDMDFQQAQNNTKWFKQYKKKVAYQMKNFELVEIDQMDNVDLFLADGGLALGIPFDDNLVTSQLKQQNEWNYGGVFSIYLNKDRNIQAIYLGGWDKYLINGEIRYIDVSYKNKNVNYWTLPISSVTVDIHNTTIPNQYESYEDEFDENMYVVKLQKNKKQKYRAILSLETTFMSFPKQFVESIINQMNQSKQFNCTINDTQNGAIQCFNLKNVSKMHDLFISLQLTDDFSLNLDPVLLIKSCKKNKKKKYDCLLNLHSNNQDQIILGEAFLRNFYTIFDINLNRIGFSYISSDMLEDEFDIIQDMPLTMQAFIFIGSIISFAVVVYVMSLIKSQIRYHSFKRPHNPYQQTNLNKFENSQTNEFNQIELTDTKSQKEWQEKVKQEIAKRSTEQNKEVDNQDIFETVVELE